MNATDYVSQYHNIVVPEFVPATGSYKLFGSGHIKCPVREYSNKLHENSAGKKWEERKDFKDHLLGFFAARSKEPGSGVLPEVGFTLVNSWAPIFSFQREGRVHG